MELDQKMEKLDAKYFRYMDDILILAPTRWKLKKAIRVLNQTFNELGLEQHPDKTLIGRTERGFDFLGYHFEPEGLSVADKTIERFKERIARLYEQGADINRIGQYVLKWVQWTCAGIHDFLNVNILAATVNSQMTQIIRIINCDQLFDTNPRSFRLGTGTHVSMVDHMWPVVPFFICHKCSVFECASMYS